MNRRSRHHGATADRGGMLTRAQVARLLGVCPSTVARWAREGRVPFLLTLGGHHRFDRGVVEALRAALGRGVRPEEDARVAREARP